MPKVKINQEMFREYDIRGIVGKDLNSKVVEEIGRAYGIYLHQKKKVTPDILAMKAGQVKPGQKSKKEKVINRNLKVVVGRDNRLSSEKYSEALIKGLTSVGCDVIDIGLVVSPIFYYAMVKYGLKGGVMITASHNPKEFNGFKLAWGASTLYGKEIQEVYRIASLKCKVKSSKLKLKVKSLKLVKEGTVEKRDIVPEYLKMLKDKIKLRKRKLKVVVDCGNGTASLFAKKILKDWGCRVIGLYCMSDGNFPNHQPDPVKEENILDLKKRVLKEKADLGIGFDGDGDRMGVIDEKGNIIWGDMMMVLFFKEVLKKYPGMDCIIEVKCSQALNEMVEKFGGKPMFYKTGHSLIKAKMKELGTKFTGEMSGHMFFADEFWGFDDAFYAAGRLLRILSNTNKTLSELLVSVPKYYSTPEVRVPISSDQAKFKIVGAVVKDFKKRFRVEDVDGVRVLFDDGWVLVRASNTQPVLVVRAEAKSKDNLEKYKKIIEDKLLSFKEVKGIDWSGKEG